METNSWGEELVVKTRKPYTITKQREKWTEEEHNKFIEALKLYGRAWQRIEEHIGTKTAVQIRSHAQKFFTKLEKEAVTKGLPFGQLHDIEIPPPRPKKKPICPYPRKTGTGSLSSSTELTEAKTTSKSPSPLGACKQATDTETSASWKIHGVKDGSEDGSCADDLNLLQDAPVASITSYNQSSSNLCTNRGFMPLKDKAKFVGSSFSNGVANKDKEGNSTAATNHTPAEVTRSCIGSQTKPAEGDGTDFSKQPDMITPFSMINVQGDQCYRKQAPMDFMKGSDGNAPVINTKPSPNVMAPTSDTNTSSGVSSIHQPFPTFPHSGQFPTDQDAYQSFLNISSVFSSLIVSTLLQNPALHAAATMAASRWPSAGVDSSTGLTSKTPPASPSLAAIAAATVAAASAWWASQGLLPIDPPTHHAGFTFSPPPAATVPAMNNAAGAADKEGKCVAFGNSVGINQQVVNPEHSEALRARHPLSKSLPSSSSSSDSDELARGDHNGDKLLSSGGIHDVDKVMSKKKLDRSSCGSNTPCSSEAETDVAAAKQKNDETDEAKQVPLGIPPSEETNNRRVRNSGSVNESWKEVSEEGRLAFQALFSREVLPQSFSPPHPKDPTVMTAKDRAASSELPVDLNAKAATSVPTDLCLFQGTSGASPKQPSSTSAMGHGKLKARRTGFKPYKRCSVEAKESSTVSGEQAVNKRIRLEEETSL